MRPIPFLILLLCGTASAHQDRIFKVLPSGEVVGIKKKFGKVMVIVRRVKAHTTVTVRIGKTTKVLPPCLAKWFSQRRRLRVTGSWWHRRSVLPPYINILPDPAAGHTISLVFSLATGKLVEANRRSAQKNGYRHVTLRSCSAGAMKRLKR